MKSLKLLFFFLLLFQIIGAQNKVLVYHETAGFRHSSIDDGIKMITDLGNANGLWAVDDSQNSNVFTTENLENYKVVIWCNTSGNGLLTNAQQAAFENYIANGGGYLGIHAATDTYRDGSWPFYNELVGAIVQTNPNHTSSNHNNTMDIVDEHQDHQSVAFLNGESWNKTEEYYYWRNNGGYLYEGNNNLLIVRETGNNNYDEARPMSWYKEYMGGRSFYTALGHNDNDYSNDQNFITHVEEGIKWAGNFGEPIPFEQLVENGDYYIQDIDLAFALETDADTNNAYTNNVNYSNNAQIWTFEHQSNNVYSIQNKSTQWFLETPAAACEDGANVGTWKDSDNDHHMFKVIALNNEQFILEPGHCENTALSATRDSQTQNAEIKNVDVLNPEQLWEIVNIDDITLSLNELTLKNANFSIYPNPVANILNIDFLNTYDVDNEVLEIYDVTGRNVLNKELEDHKNAIDISVFSKGVYFLNLKSNNSAAFKIVKR